MIEWAADQGDFLVVSVTADPFVDKGEGRPIFNHNERAYFLSRLKEVDQVDICHEKTGLSMIHKWQPALYVKGADYITNDKHGSLGMERKVVESYGGKLVLSPTAGYSSSAIVERIRNG